MGALRAQYPPLIAGLPGLPRHPFFYQVPVDDGAFIREAAAGLALQEPDPAPGGYFVKLPDAQARDLPGIFAGKSHR